MFAISIGTLLPDRSLARTREQHMEALLATYPIYADAKIGPKLFPDLRRFGRELAIVLTQRMSEPLTPRPASRASSHATPNDVAF